MKTLAELDVEDLLGIPRPPRSSRAFVYRGKGIRVRKYGDANAVTYRTDQWYEVLPAEPDNELFTLACKLRHAKLAIDIYLDETSWK